MPSLASLAGGVIGGALGGPIGGLLGGLVGGLIGGLLGGDPEDVTLTDGLPEDKVQIDVSGDGRPDKIVANVEDDEIRYVISPQGARDLAVQRVTYELFDERGAWAGDYLESTHPRRVQARFEFAPLFPGVRNTIPANLGGGNALLTEAEYNTSSSRVSAARRRAPSWRRPAGGGVAAPHLPCEPHQALPRVRGPGYGRYPLLPRRQRRRRAGAVPRLSQGAVRSVPRPGGPRRRGQAGARRAGHPHHHHRRRRSRRSSRRRGRLQRAGQS